MTSARTDLALECMDFQRPVSVPGVEYRRFLRDGISCEQVRVNSKEGAKRLGKPPGVYLTLEAAPFRENADVLRQSGVLAKCVEELLPPSCSAALVAGLGNRGVMSDSLGPRVADRVFATRHLSASLTRKLGLHPLCAVSVFSPGVLGQTGVESAELISALCQTVRPQVVIAVDALACSQPSRIGKTVQLTDAGIVPGSGVRGNRTALCCRTLGVPVLALGVPLAAELPQREGEETLLVTPREIDAILEHAAKLLACALNRALQPKLSAEEILAAME